MKKSKTTTEAERAYLRIWLRRLVQERIDFVETCKASGLKVNTLDEAVLVCVYRELT